MSYRAMGYVRITPKEELSGFLSLEDQEKQIKKYSEEIGIKNIEIFSDEPIPKAGSIDTSLGGIFTLLDEVRRSKRIQFVIVTSLDRLIRNETDVNFFAELVRINKKILEVGQDYNIYEVKLPTDQEVEDVFDDDGFGRQQSGPIPYGYKKDDNCRGHGVSIVPDEVESKVVRYIFETYEVVESYARLQRLLESKNMLTRRKNPWSRAGLSWLLKNEIYAGYSRHGSDENYRDKNSHTPIITEDLFKRVQEVVKKKQRRKRKSSG